MTSEASRWRCREAAALIREALERLKTVDDIPVVNLDRRILSGCEARLSQWAVIPGAAQDVSDGDTE